MKISIKRITICLLCISMLISLTACGIGDKASTYQSYVKSLLSVNYLGATEDYLKATGANESDAKELYESNAKHLANNLKSYYNFDIADDSATMQQLIQLSKNIYSKSKFKISKAYKENDNFYVDVTINPINILNDTNASVMDYITTFNDKVNNGDYREYTKEKYEAEFSEGLITILSDSINDITYEEPVELKIQIQISDSTFSISEEDFLLIDSTIIATGSTNETDVPTEDTSEDTTNDSDNDATDDTN